MTRSRTKQPLVAAFGGVLKHLHQRHERTQRRVLSHATLTRVLNQRLAARIGPVVSVGATTLWRWQEGQTAGPDPLILRELADLYGAPVAGLLAVLEANLRDPELTTEAALHILERARAETSQEPHTQKKSANVTSPVTGPVVDSPHPSTLEESPSGRDSTIPPSLVYTTVAQLRESAGALSALADHLLRESLGARAPAPRTDTPRTAAPGSRSHRVGARARHHRSVKR